MVVLPCRAGSIFSAWCSTRLADSRDFAVTFDLWQTLIFELDGNSNSMERRIARTNYVTRELARLGEVIEPEVVKESFRVLSDEITAGHDHGHDAQFEEWISILIDRLVPGLEKRVGSDEILNMAQLIDQTFIEAPPLLLDGTKDVFRELVGRGVKIGLISNTGLTSPQMYCKWFDQLGVHDDFSFLAFSNEQAVAKPDAKIFEVTLNGLGVAAERALHVGDNLHTDVGGAAAVGMSTVWVRGGTNSPVESTVEPGFKIDSILEMPVVVDEWQG